MPVLQAISWRSPGTLVAALGQLADGPAASQPNELAESIGEAAEHAAGGIALAALPFDRSAPTAVLTPIRAHAPEPAAVPELLAAGESDPAAYLAGVSTITERIAAGGVDKAVLARYRELSSTTDIDPLTIAARLARVHPVAHVFALPIGEDRHLVGASPELLIAKNGRALRSHPLAGSARRSPDVGTDRDRADALRTSEKDLREHAFVVEAICDTLAPYCRRITAPGPDLLATDTMWHLGTEITAELRDDDVPVARLAAELHPTPAVCGTPRNAATGLIAETEPFDREFYAGAVGTQNTDGDGEWAVSIRCGVVSPNRVRAYAGAGIVAGSDPQTELAETTGKLATFLAAVTPRVEAS